jgi:hypothetical protein
LLKKITPSSHRNQQRLSFHTLDATSKLPKTGAKHANISAPLRCYQWGFLLNSNQLKEVEPIVFYWKKW